MLKYKEIISNTLLNNKVNDKIHSTNEIKLQNSAVYHFHLHLLTYLFLLNKYQLHWTCVIKTNDFILPTLISTFKNYCFSLTITHRMTFLPHWSINVKELILQICGHMPGKCQKICYLISYSISAFNSSTACQSLLPKIKQYKIPYKFSNSFNDNDSLRVFVLYIISEEFVGNISSYIAVNQWNNSTDSGEAHKF